MYRISHYKIFLVFKSKFKNTFLKMTYNEYKHTIKTVQGFVLEVSFSHPVR